MIKIFRVLASVAVLVAVAGCASQPPVVVYPDPPPKKRLDAKSQLESGSKY